MVAEQKEALVTPEACEGVTRLRYNVASAEDVINPLSPVGYELASDGIVDYLELVRPSISLDRPVELELVGCQLSETQLRAAARGVSVHYQIRLAETLDLMRSCRLKTLWFVLCFIASSVLLFINTNGVNEVLVQYLYLPFWFFGYRVITFPLLDYQPVRREKKRIEHFLAMEMVCECEGTVHRVALSDFAAGDYGVQDGDNLHLECVVGSAEDAVSPASVRGSELLSDEMRSYLGRVEYFVTKRSVVGLKVQGPLFSEEQQDSIRSAVRNYYGLMTAQVRETLVHAGRKTAVFALCLVISSLILLILGSFVSVATHELMLILLWFFGDYLVEFMWLEHISLRQLEQSYKGMETMKVSFEVSER